MDTRHPRSPLDVTGAPPDDHACGRLDAASPPEAGQRATGSSGGHAWDPTRSEISVQLDELSRCLARMDAVMEMIEADLDRRELALAALVEPFPEALSPPRAAVGTGLEPDPEAAVRSHPQAAGTRSSAGRSTTRRRPRRSRPRRRR